jgi:hypothetical protein
MTQQLNSLTTEQEALIDFIDFKTYYKQQYLKEIRFPLQKVYEIIKEQLIIQYPNLLPRYDMISPDCHVVDMPMWQTKLDYDLYQKMLELNHFIHANAKHERGEQYQQVQSSLGTFIKNNQEFMQQNPAFAHAANNSRLAVQAYHELYLDESLVKDKTCGHKCALL